MRVNGTLVEDKMRRFKGECEHFSFNKCPIYTHDGASAKFSPNSQEMDNSVCNKSMREKFTSLSLQFNLFNQRERKLFLHVNVCIQVSLNNIWRSLCDYITVITVYLKKD